MASKNFAPPLPVPLVPALSEEIIRSGCYVMSFQRVGESTHRGTLRVTRDDNDLIVSGDLYDTDQMPVVNDIPIFPKDVYHTYLQSTAIRSNTLAHELIISFKQFNYTPPSHGNPLPQWNLAGEFVVALTDADAAADVPPAERFVGNVKDGDAGAVIGVMSLRWVSAYVRRAAIELDAVEGCNLPMDNGAGLDWQTIFDRVHWQIDPPRVISSETTHLPIASVQGDWKLADLHAAMLEWRSTVDLDARWLYHIVVVPKIEGVDRGIMFDDGAINSNNLPREGAALAAKWRFPNFPGLWGVFANARFHTAPQPYFRTAIHEIGHAMCLTHVSGNWLMNTTDLLPGDTFPDNLLFDFGSQDRRRLCHYPDIVVRPGGVPFMPLENRQDRAPAPVISPPDLALLVTAVESHIPLGAPVRINIQLQNTGARAVDAPTKLDLSTGFVTGTVSRKLIQSDPVAAGLAVNVRAHWFEVLRTRFGTLWGGRRTEIVHPASFGEPRSFASLLLCADDQPIESLARGASVSHSFLLLHGRAGALFREPGEYQVRVETRWTTDNGNFLVSGETTIVIDPPRDDDQRRVAENVFNTPDATIVATIGGHHLTTGIKAIQGALKIPTLAPHFHAIEAIRLSQAYLRHAPDLTRAAQLIDDASVMTVREIEHTTRLIERANLPESRLIANVLSRKIATVPVNDSTRLSLDRLRRPVP